MRWLKHATPAELIAMLACLLSAAFSGTMVVVLLTGVIA